ncbi:MAG: DUF2911 domain-containing protein [Bacteroidota bacterium]|jgi:hypothetical protein
MLTKHLTILGLIAVGISFLAAQAPPVKLMRLSQYATVSQTVGVTDMTITYHRPGVKGRVIFGGLEQFGKVWRAGANNATSFEFSQDVTIAGTTLKAGRYEFFLIPTENEWTVIFNSAKDQWGAYSYDSTLNVVTFQVKPETIPHEEWLSYSFSDLTISSAKVSMKWGTTAVSFVISTNTEENVKKLEAQYSSLAAQQAATYARYSLDSKSNVDAGIDAANRAIAIAPNFSNLSLKANLLAQKESWADAVKTGEEAIKAGKADNANIGNFEKTVSGWKEKLPAEKKKKK